MKATHVFAPSVHNLFVVSSPAVGARKALPAHSIVPMYRTCVRVHVCFDQSEELIGEVRQVLCEAKGDGVKIDGISLRNGGQQNADDTAIVQSVGAPFAALQWREEDSLKNFRFVA